MKLGVTLPQFTGDAGRFVGAAHRAESLGFDSVWLFDHLWPLGQKRRSVLEGWTSLAHLAAATTTIGVGTLVTRSSLRHSALLAKMAATVGTIAPGRVVVGLGSGDDLSRPENDAFGLPFFEADVRAEQLETTLEVLTRYFTEGSVNRRDGFVDLRDLPPSPTPPDPPAVWLGGWAPAVTRLAGESAQGWNGWGRTPDHFARAAEAVRAAAKGRNVELSWGGQVILGAGDSEARDKLGDRNPAMYETGSPETVAASLRRWVDAGANHLVVAMPDAGEPEVHELLAAEVRPRLEGGL